MKKTLKEIPQAEGKAIPDGNSDLQKEMKSIEMVNMKVYIKNI